MINGLNVFQQQASPALCPFVRFVCLQCLSVCLFYPIQAGAMASLADLAAATEELSEEVRCIFLPRCLVKPADLYTPRTSAFATDAPGSTSSLTRENSPNARRNHFPFVPFSPVLLSRLAVDCRRAGLGRHLIIEREKCKQGLLRCNLQPNDCSVMTRRNKQSPGHREE